MMGRRVSARARELALLGQIAEARAGLFRIEGDRCIQTLVQRSAPETRLLGAAGAGLVAGLLWPTANANPDATPAAGEIAKSRARADAERGTASEQAREPGGQTGALARTGHATGSLLISAAIKTLADALVKRALRRYGMAADDGAGRASASQR
jgi:hypothetical protein